MKSLTEASVQQYRETGYLAPIRVLSTSDAAQIRAKLETFEAEAGSPRRETPAEIAPPFHLAERPDPA